MRRFRDRFRMNEGRAPGGGVLTLPQLAAISFLMDIRLQTDVTAGLYNSVLDNSGNGRDFAYVAGGVTKAVKDSTKKLGGFDTLLTVNNGFNEGCQYKSAAGVDLAGDFFPNGGEGTKITVFSVKGELHLFGSNDLINVNAAGNWEHSITTGHKFRGKSNASSADYGTNLSLDTWYVGLSRFNATNIRTRIDLGAQVTQAGDARTASTDRAQLFNNGGTAGTFFGNYGFDVWWNIVLSDVEVTQAFAYLKAAFAELNV